MSIIKDWREDNQGYRLRMKVTKLFSPREWFYLHKWRKQRANRGWSDRDTWNMGDHLIEITAAMLNHLNTNGIADWPEWFKLNVQEKGKNAYTSLDQVIKDITDYIDFEKTSWADGLDTKRDSIDETFKERQDGNYEYIGPDWYEGDKKLSEAAIKNRINNWQKEWDKEYKKATNAMQWVGRHIAGLWD